VTPTSHETGRWALSAIVKHHFMKSMRYTIFFKNLGKKEKIYTFVVHRLKYAEDISDANQF